MPRLIAVADIHGCFKELMELWDEIHFMPGNDIIVFLGDLIDRGPNSFEVVSFCHDLKNCFPENIVLIMGNHEKMLIEHLENEDDENKRNHFLMNGGLKTVQSFAGKERDIYWAADFFKSEFHMIFETEKFIFAHANYPAHCRWINLEKESGWFQVLWDRNFDESPRPKKCIVGHTPNKMHPYWYGDLLCVDNGCFNKGKLYAVDVLTNDFYSSKERI